MLIMSKMNHFHTVEMLDRHCLLVWNLLRIAPSDNTKKQEKSAQQPMPARLLDRVDVALVIGVCVHLQGMSVRPSNATLA